MYIVATITTSISIETDFDPREITVLTFNILGLRFVSQTNPSLLVLKIVCPMP